MTDLAPEACSEAGMSAETWLLTEPVYLVLFTALLRTNMHTHTHTLLTLLSQPVDTRATAKY